jgi:DNA polymerase IV
MRAACVHIPHFYIQVTIQKDHQLYKKPIIIGTPGDKGCVIGCSEELIEKGISLSMPLKNAQRLCPDALCIHVIKRMCRYLGRVSL